MSYICKLYMENEFLHIYFIQIILVSTHRKQSIYNQYINLTITYYYVGIGNNMYALKPNKDLLTY